MPPAAEATGGDVTVSHITDGEHAVLAMRSVVIDCCVPVSFMDQGSCIVIPSVIFGAILFKLYAK